MKLNFILVLVALIISPVPLYASEPSLLENNEELTQIFDMDQADRHPGPEGIDWAAVSKRDAVRRSRTLELLRQGAVRTSEDFRHAAYIFQHGESIEDFRLALSLAWVAASIDPDNKNAKWLTAAAWDRLLMNQGHPQWYGTQYRRDPESNEWQLYEVQEDAVTDEQRIELNVPSLAKAREKIGQLNSN